MSTEESLPQEVPAGEPAPGEESTIDAEAPESPDWSREMPTISRASRFLYVDVAARRAKQLRRGALPRLAALAPDAETGERPVPVSKLERVAMEEVDEGLIAYALPEVHDSAADGA